MLTSRPSHHTTPQRRQLFKRNMLIDPDQPILRDQNIPGKTALPEEMRRDAPPVRGRRKRLGPVQPAHTEIVLEPQITVRRLLAQTVLALAAARVAHNHMVARRHFGYAGPDPFDNSGPLVAQHRGEQLGHRFLPGEVEVRVAYPGGFDVDGHFVRSERVVELDLLVPKRGPRVGYHQGVCLHPYLRSESCGAKRRGL